MVRFGDVDDQYDPHATEERVFEHWERVEAYEKTKDHRSDGESFFFVDGPPYTSGAAHLGTTWNKTLKDAYLRYLRMQGYAVTDRPGYDMHGLPIETKVEEKLGFENKKDIEAFGIEAFVDECKKFANKQLEGLQDDFISFGVWMDWENPYKTLTPTYMEAAWWGFAKTHERGLVERGKRSISQCPRCETAIAKNEVEYHQVEDPSIYVKFPLVDRDGSLVIWTTTPWTLPGNTFVAVDPELVYQSVRAEKDGDSEVLWIAEPLVEEVLKKGRYDEFEIIEEAEGSDLIEWKYEHPLANEVPEHPVGEDALRVYGADYVEADRTGLVHSAPGHGEDDFARGQEIGLDVFCPVEGDGVFTVAAGKYAGQFVRDANAEIIADLESKGLMLASETIVHDYGQCWRCDTDIIQIVTDQWFITVTDIKEELLANLEESEWYPSWARDHRFRDFVEDAPDWNVSRQRYWGIPLPIWTPDGASPEEEATDMIVIGSRDELAEKVDQAIDPTTVDLHKPNVDELTITRDGKTYTRVPDVFDVWLDSSVATWGTLDYPENQAAFDELWPADLIMEAHDQTRGWFWSQLGMGTAALDEMPYERVLMHGHALDEDGRKMSKSIGNVIEPQEAINRHGADSMRLFLLAQTPQGSDMRFSWDEMAEMKRRLNILWNVFRFPLPYMRMDDFDPTSVTVSEVRLETVDEWILSRLQSVKRDATDAWELYEQHKALRSVLEFVVEDVSRYYIQVVRERMWEEEASESKTAAYTTLYKVLFETVVLIAPFAPFIAEDIYGNLTGDDHHPTVHMSDWPGVNDELQDTELEGEIAIIRRIEEAGSHARQEGGRKLRWPVRRVVIDADTEDVGGAVSVHEALLADRLNTREIDVITPDDEWREHEYDVTLDMSLVGPQFGDQASEILQTVSNTRLNDPDLDELNDVVAETLGDPVELTMDMVEFVKRPPEGVVGSSFEGGVVYVDTTLTNDIEAEGYAREVIRRVQEMRKDLDLEMDAEIRLDMEIYDDRVADLVKEHEEFITGEVRAAELEGITDGYEKEWDVEDVRMRFAIAQIGESNTAQ